MPATFNPYAYSSLRIRQRDVDMVGSGNSVNTPITAKADTGAMLTFWPGEPGFDTLAAQQFGGSWSPPLSVTKLFGAPASRTQAKAPGGVAGGGSGGGNQRPFAGVTGTQLTGPLGLSVLTRDRRQRLLGG